LQLLDHNVGAIKPMTIQENGWKTFIELYGRCDCTCDNIMCHVLYFKTRLGRLNIVAIVGDIHDLKLVVKFSD